MIQSDRQRVLLDVVRGEKPWLILQQYGFDVSFYDGCWRFGPCLEAPLVVSPSDIAKGLLQYSREPKLLREWASFILAASSLIDLRELEANDALLDNMWDASFGKALKSTSLSIARRLVGSE